MYFKVGNVSAGYISYIKVQSQIYIIFIKITETFLHVYHVYSTSSH